MAKITYFEETGRFSARKAGYLATQRAHFINRNMGRMLLSKARVYLIHK